MIELGRHGGFILASYAVPLVVFGFLALATLRRYRRARERLAAMDAAED
jgi:heme exporter protein CcmD